MAVAPGSSTRCWPAFPSPARLSLGQQVPFRRDWAGPKSLPPSCKHIIENEMLNGGVHPLDGALRMAAK